MSEAIKLTVETPFELTRLEVTDGTVLLLNTPLCGAGPTKDGLAVAIGEAIERELLERTGKKVSVIVSHPGTTIEAIPAEMLEKLGWIRAQTLEEKEDTTKHGG